MNCTFSKTRKDAIWGFFLGKNRTFGNKTSLIAFLFMAFLVVHFWRRRKWLLWPKWSDWVILRHSFSAFREVNKAQKSRASLGKTENHDKKPHRVQSRTIAAAAKRELLNFMNANELFPVNLYLTKSSYRAAAASLVDRHHHRARGGEEP